MIRSAVGFSCHHCGSPLPATEAAALICHRCGAANYLRPQHTRASQLPRELLAAFGLLFCLSVIGGILVLLLARRAHSQLSPPRPTSAPAIEPTPPAPSTGTSGTTIVSWSGNPGGRMCLVDVDRDGVLDIVGRAGPITALHGNTGRQLWSNAALPSGVTLYCDPRGGLVAYRKDDFGVSGLEPSSGREVWSGKLGDKLADVAFGEGCVVVRASDGSRMKVDLRTGAKATCADAVVQPPPPSLSDRGRPIRVGDLDVVVTGTSGAGTPRALVRGTRGSRPVWETTIPEIAADPRLTSRLAAFHASPRGIYLAGKKHGGPGIVVALLDPVSGAVVAKRVESPLEQDDAFFMHVDVTPNAVLVESFGMLHVYAPTTLAPRWWAGSMWARE